MKILFTVQGEGRGHMTQAIAAHEMLRRRGHELVGVVAGGDVNRKLPEFFTDAFRVEVQRIESPGFVQHGNRGVSLVLSSAQILKSLPAYKQSLATIEKVIHHTEPDVIVNFLEPLMGVYNLLKRPDVPTVAVGHQFMMEHPVYLRVKEFPFQRLGMCNYVSIVGARSFKVALSFYPAAPLPSKKLTVCPPILRRQIFGLTPTRGERLLVYLLFHGFSQNVIEWSKAHPNVPIECFYDRPNAPAEERYSDSLTFHRLDGEKFLRKMAECRGVVCTAGFESVSEAAYLQKPLLMVPVPNHLEQFINSQDAENVGLGIRDLKFSLSRLIEEPVAASDEFKAWVDRAEDILMEAVEAAVEDCADGPEENFDAIARNCAI